ncbi:MAG: beta-lactamase family protein [Colwellia sp.]|nr:beta-lactamase family protein [Colwellia sp.]
MKYLISILLVTALFILTSLKLTYAVEEISPSMRISLDQQLAKNAARYGVVGQAVLILKNHQQIYRGQHGFANIELGVAITDQHLFPSYSITKLLTSVLIMQQVDNGNINLTRSIRTYLPYLPKRWQAVTVEHLLSHTSGIPRYFDIAMESRNFLPTKKAVFLSLIDEPEHFKLGTKNSYNNTNFLLLSAILESKTGKSYQALVTEIIIKPLGLKNTGHASAKAIINNMVTSYQGANGIIKRNIDIDWPEYTYAHSALYSTPEDLTTFMTALVTGQFISQSTLTKFWQPMKLANGKNGRYALGFEYSFEDGYYQAGHDGGNRVKLRHYFNTENSLDNFTIAYLTNGNANNVWTDVLAESLMSIVDPEAFKMATLKEQFMTAILEKKINDLPAIYQAVSNIYDGDKASIERFFLYRAYALRYGSGAAFSLPAFKFLIAKFPNSTAALEGFTDTKAAIEKNKEGKLTP